MKVVPVLVAVQSLGTLAVTAGVLFMSLHPPAAEPPPPAASVAAHQEAAHPEAAAPGTEAARKEDEPGTAGVRKALLEGNQRFVGDHPRPHQFAAERKALTKGQHPKAMVLSCSDSRLPPELIFDQSLGDLFVVRTAGNVADKLGLGSLEYGAEHLHAKVLVVLGHEKCGAITAAAKGATMPTENLQALMDELTPSLKDLRGTYEGDQLVHRGVEANVSQTADEVLDRSPMLRHLVAQGELEVIQAVYDLETGVVRVLSGPERAAARARL